MLYRLWGWVPHDEKSKWQLSSYNIFNHGDKHGKKTSVVREVLVWKYYKLMSPPETLPESAGYVSSNIYTNKYHQTDLNFRSYAAINSLKLPCHIVWLTYQSQWTDWGVCFTVFGINWSWSSAGCWRFPLYSCFLHLFSSTALSPLMVTL